MKPITARNCVKNCVLKCHHVCQAANAIVDTVFSLLNDTPGDNWHSVAVCLDGSHDVEKALISSFHARVRTGKWEIVQDIPLNDSSREKIKLSVAEIKEEKSLVSELLS